MSYHPSISHYRRVHAPNRFYLPSELSIRQMYQIYLEDGRNARMIFTEDSLRWYYTIKVVSGLKMEMVKNA